MMSFKTCLALTFAALWVLAIGSPAAAEPERIGVIFGLTGDAAKWSASMRRGIELAAAEEDAKGTPVRLLWEDSGTSPQKAVSAFRKLTEQDGVTVILGDVFTFVTEPLIPLAERTKTLLITPSLPETFCAQSKGHFFSTASQIPQSESAFRSYLTSKPDIRRVAIINFGDVGWGGAYRAVWEKLFKELGREVVSQRDNLDFTADALSIVGAVLEKKPQTVFVAHNPLTMLKALRHYKYAGDIVFVNQLLEPFLDKGYDRSIAEGVYFVDTAGSPDFVDRYRKRFNEEPYLESYTGYETLRAALLAIRMSGSPAANFKTIHYTGVSGELDFRTTCAGNRAPWHLKRIKHGAVRTISQSAQN